MKRHRLLASVLLIIGFLLPGYTLSAQGLFKSYPSQDHVDFATQEAKDSIGPDAFLVGIATLGEIDLSEIGFNNTVPGFSRDDGTSTVWAYLFMTPSGDHNIGVAVVEFLIGGPQALALLDDIDMFVQEPDSLDLTGAHSGSNAFADQLQSNPTFIKYHDDYGDAIPDTVVLVWFPRGVNELPTAGFPDDKPIWAIYYGGEELSDSSMACFVSSGNGMDTCIRGVSISVPMNETHANNLSLSIRPNPFTTQDEVVVQIRTVNGTEPERIGLYDVKGREVRDLSSLIEIEGNSEYTVAVNVSDIPSGPYFCRVVSGESLHTIPLIVE